MSGQGLLGGVGMHGTGEEGQGGQGEEGAQGGGLRGQGMPGVKAPGQGALQGAHEVGRSSGTAAFKGAVDAAQQGPGASGQAAAAAAAGWEGAAAANSAAANSAAAAAQQTRAFDQGPACMHATAGQFAPLLPFLPKLLQFLDRWVQPVNLRLIIQVNRLRHVCYFPVFRAGPRQGRPNRS